MNKTTLLSLLLVASITACACQRAQNGSRNETENNTANSTGTTEPSRSPSPFSADSAYQHIQAQVNFGPRVPNTPSHVACGNYLYSKLQEYGLQLTEQRTTLKAYDETPLQIRNIIASYKPEATKRVLLFAHWDTRPISDHDPNHTNYNKPIMGADDGGSGTGVLLEIARLLQQHPLQNIGVDIALFDAEDYGAPEAANYTGDSEKTWALGTQYWTKNPHTPNYRAEVGILLDMVGARGAKFYREYYSQEYAGKYASQIWSIAHQLGHQDFFINDQGGAITDDHIFVIRGLGIPCVDILNYDPASATGFGKHWHTQQDDMDIIDKETLRAAGETVWQVLNEWDKNL